MSHTPTYHSLAGSIPKSMSLVGTRTRTDVDSDRNIGNDDGITQRQGQTRPSDVEFASQRFTTRDSEACMCVLSLPIYIAKSTTQTTQKTHTITCFMSKP